MKKMPWGIFAGISAMCAFFLTVAFVAAYIVFGAIAQQTHSDFSMFQNWWQVLIFIADILSVLSLIGFVVLYIIREKEKRHENI